MPDLAAISKRAAREHLAVMGAFHAAPEHGVGGGGTLVLLGPGEPGFWAHVVATPEFADGAPDPLDRWSARVVGRIADDLDGTALFPFGRPVRPFMSWALASGRAWTSPVGLLVHDTAGLMVSYRGAVLVPKRIDLPATGCSPCETCVGRPCLSACPVGALGSQGYALDRCHDFLDTDAGQPCMNEGCAVRRACPISRGCARDLAQSAYHMKQFH